MKSSAIRWAVFGAVAVAALVLGWRFGVDEAYHSPTNGKAIFGVSLPDTEGRNQALDQWQGKVLVVNFWATWCIPCREEMPEFIKAQSDLGQRGVQFVGIAIDKEDKVADFAKELKLNYPALIGGYGALELSKTLGNRVGALPFTIILDRSGQIVHTQLGPIKDEKLRSIVGQLL